MFGPVQVQVLSGPGYMVAPLIKGVVWEKTTLRLQRPGSPSKQLWAFAFRTAPIDRVLHGEKICTKYKDYNLLSLYVMAWCKITCFASQITVEGFCDSNRKMIHNGSC